VQIEINITMLIAIASVVFTAYNTFTVHRRAVSTDARTDTVTITTILVKLESIEKGVGEIRADSAAMRGEFQELRDKVIANDQSLKNAWQELNVLIQRTG